MHDLNRTEDISRFLNRWRQPEATVSGHKIGERVSFATPWRSCAPPVARVLPGKPGNLDIFIESAGAGAILSRQPKRCVILASVVRPVKTPGTGIDTQCGLWPRSRSDRGIVRFYGMFLIA